MSDTFLMMPLNYRLQLEVLKHCERGLQASLFNGYKFMSVELTGRRMKRYVKINL